MKQKIFKNTSIMVVLSVLVTFVAMSVVLYQRTYHQIQQALKNESGYIQQAMNQYGVDYLTQEVGDITSSRVTLFDENEQVLFDSVRDTEDVSETEDRPEVRSAMQKGYGEARRYSKTLGTETVYYAARLDNGMVVRVSATVDSVFKTLFSGITLVGLLIIGIMILAIFLVYYQTDKIIAPINRVNLDDPGSGVVYEELTPLMRRIRQQKDQINRQVEQMKQNQEEYLAITENMKDGLIVTNRSEVIAINKAAQKIFSADAKDCINHDILTVYRKTEIKEALEQVIAGTPQELQEEISGKKYQIRMNPVIVSGQITGAVLMVLDVTQKVKAEAMRREFTANVSHELKTPLMSISGYAELMMNQLVRQEDIPEFSKRIYQEASRLKSLVEDIIKLSHLEEQGQKLEKEEVELYGVAKEVCAGLQMPAQKRKVGLELSGKTAIIYGVRRVVYEMIYNLCDNAIKYNIEGGSVRIRVDAIANTAVLTVEDTGIGIPKKDQERIFERFYRVDKSHSRQTGGTGLGLSIVKHGANMHDAKIKVESEEGKGTKIWIVFKK